MKLFLDIRISLRVVLGAPQRTPAARRLIEDADRLYVSTVSLWELAIKRSLGKLRLDTEALDADLAAGAVVPLTISWAHAQQLRALPSLYGDPFDRMLVAQATTEPLHLLTHDAAVRPYSPLVVFV